jgi:6-pyruvoyl-tetrahydropterin synthase
MMLVGARATFCASHKLAYYDDIHGHSYEVWAYVRCSSDEDFNVEALQGSLALVCKTLDHAMLNDRLSGKPTMENIAIYIAMSLEKKLRNPYRVVVSRPLEGLSCEWIESVP